MWLKYQKKMSERLQTLQEAVSQVKQANLSPEVQHNAEKAAHKLAGVLGMFDRETGTDIAREIETLLQEHPVLNVQQQERLIALVTDLDNLLVLDDSSDHKPIIKADLLLISCNHQLAQELQQLGKTQKLGWHQLNNLAQAKTWLQSHSPDAVVIDSCNQQDCLSLIRELSSLTPAIPTIVVAETDSFQNRLAASRAGANSFLPQPVTPSQIWQTTNKLIEQNQANTASILIVDDDLIFLDAVRSLLEPWGIKVSVLESPSSFWQVLQATQPDLVILDVEMPEINGLELCQALRSDPDWQELPVLFLTARQDAQTIQQIFEIGGDDYISKPIVGAELLARINHRLDRSLLLHNLATQDRLTGLSNRPQSSRAIENLLQQAQNNHQPFCLAVIKIAQLPQINLDYGHKTGDRILAQWGKVIQAALRNAEITSYWGNGDFLVGMPNLDKNRGKERLSELLAVLRKQVFTSPEGNRFQVAFDCTTAELTKDRGTLHSLYQACMENNSSLPI